jgi:hypothetical protein
MVALLSAELTIGLADQSDDDARVLIVINHRSGSSTVKGGFPELFFQEGRTSPVGRGIRTIVRLRMMAAYNCPL